MSRLQKAYIIEIHYPKSEEGIYKLRKRVIEAFDKLFKEHIRFLSISEREKKKVYDEMMESIVHHEGNDEN